jgi:hypothetical protein
MQKMEREQAYCSINGSTKCYESYNIDEKEDNVMTKSMDDLMMMRVAEISNNIMKEDDECIYEQDPNLNDI